MTLANFHYGQGRSTNTDRRRGIKGSSHDKLSGNVSLSCFEKTHFISITAGILCPIFQISVLPALQILCQSPTLKNLCQPRYIIPPTSSLPLLMWQNKLWPIRIKALKRSLKPLKVPLNWGMTIWAVWQQMLNRVIASPSQWGLQSHNTRA